MIKHEAGVNWRKVKAEYIAGGISQRKLAEKYDIPWGTMRTRANEEKWGAARKRAEEKAMQKAEQKTAEIVADNATLLEQGKRAILLKVIGMIGAFPDKKAGRVKERTGSNTEYTEKEYSLKDLAAILAALEDKIPAGQSIDIEDLTPLSDLLK